MIDLLWKMNRISCLKKWCGDVRSSEGEGGSLGCKGVGEWYVYGVGWGGVGGEGEWRWESEERHDLIQSQLITISTSEIHTTTNTMILQAISKYNES